MLHSYARCLHMKLLCLLLIKSQMLSITQKSRLLILSIIFYQKHKVSLLCIISTLFIHKIDFFFFIQNSFKSLRSKNLIKENFFDSISELFYAANWLEREIAELHGCLFYGKKDSRNLMLQYGDLTVPFQKSSPSIGYKELIFNIIVNMIVEIRGSVQA